MSIPSLSAQVLNSIPHSNTVQIQLRLGTEFKDVELEDTTTFLKVKKIAATLFNIPVNTIQCIVLAGRRLNDDDAIKELSQTTIQSYPFIIVR